MKTWSIMKRMARNGVYVGSDKEGIAKERFVPHVPPDEVLLFMLGASAMTIHEEEGKFVVATFTPTDLMPKRSWEIWEVNKYERLEDAFAEAVTRLTALDPDSNDYYGIGIYISGFKGDC